MRQCTGWALLQIMACRLFGTKPWSEPVLGYCQLDLGNKVQWNFNQNTRLFIHENASQNIVCDTAAILSRGDELMKDSHVKLPSHLGMLIFTCKRATSNLYEIRTTPPQGKAFLITGHLWRESAGHISRDYSRMGVRPSVEEGWPRSTSRPKRKTKWLDRRHHEPYAEKTSFGRDLVEIPQSVQVAMDMHRLTGPPLV